jgi:hypothetical protein
MGHIIGRRGERFDVTDSVAERRERLERIAAVVVLVAGVIIIGAIGVLVMHVRGAL